MENEYNKPIMAPNPMTPCKAIHINSSLCTGCMRCVEVCRIDVLVPGGKKGEPPKALYPDECWFCGVCMKHCPVPGAIKMEYPLNQRVGWKRKESGEYFRIGMKNPPTPDTRPPVGKSK